MELPNDGQGTPVVAHVPDDFSEFEKLANEGARFVGADVVTKEKPAESADAGASDDAGADGSETEGGDEGADKEGQGEEGSPSDEEGEKPKPKSKGGFQRKLEQREARIKELEAELAAKGGADKVAEKNAEPVSGKAKPREADFDTYEAFTDALTAWHLDEREAQKVAAERVATHQAKAKQVVEAHHTRETDFKKAHTDYDARLDAVEDVEFSPIFTTELIGSDVSAALVYEIAGNRAEAERLAKLSFENPGAALRELGKIEARLSTPVKTKTPSVSQAPDPITPGGRGGKGSVPKQWKVTDPDCPLDVFERLQREAGR